jgi:hypothetical protein
METAKTVHARTHTSAVPSRPTFPARYGGQMPVASPEPAIKRFLFRLGCFCILQIAMGIVVLRVGSTRQTNHYLSAILDKLELLDATESPRLIFVGGSNVAFGIDSEQIGNVLKRQPVNFGLHAGLGLDFALLPVEQAIRPGDTIIVMPEYGLLASEAQGGHDATIAQMLEQWPEAYHYFDTGLEDVKSFLDTGGLWLAHLWVQRARRRLSKRASQNGVYTRGGFNRYGDMVAHYGSPPVDIDDRHVVNDFSDEHLDRAVERLNRFHAVCREKGGQVFFAYPPYPRSQFRVVETSIARLHDKLTKLLTMPIIDTPENFTLPEDHFFDTVYHLTEKGARRRSRHLAIRLAEYLEHPSQRPMTARRNVRESL